MQTDVLEGNLPRRLAVATLAAELMLPLAAGLMLPLAASAEPAAPRCDPPIDLVRLANPLPRLTAKIATGGTVTIVAIGSSSTAGAGASSPAATYPSRLAVELKRHFPGRRFNVINRGVGGEETGDMLRRFDEAVVAAKPDLVLWQLGTNSVIRDHAIGDHGALIRAGLKKIRLAGADTVLIDPQFAPKVIVKPEAEHMVELIATTAKQEDVDLFRRYEVMKRWYKVDRLGFEKIVAPDGLHMNDWSYACMAKGLGLAIAEAARRPVLSATATHYAVP